MADIGEEAGRTDAGNAPRQPPFSIILRGIVGHGRTVWSTSRPHAADRQARLSAIRLGGPRDAVVARRHQANRRGRPLEAARAWREILAGGVELASVGRYRERATVRRYQLSAGDLAHLAAHPHVRRSGVAAAIELGQLLPPEHAAGQFYLTASAAARLLGDIAAIDDPLGCVILRVVDDAVWPFTDKPTPPAAETAPPAAVALDLMDSGDPRVWIAAEALLAGLHG